MGFPESEDYFLFSPASTYPEPKAFLVDASGALVHAWSSSHAQPKSDTSPPGFLKGWNHVEVDECGNLYAVVPLQALLKLTPESQLIFESNVTAHHDLAVTHTGETLVLTEAPLIVPEGGNRSTIVLDNKVTRLDSQGTIQGETSLFKLLESHLVTRQIVRSEMRKRRQEIKMLEATCSDYTELFARIRKNSNSQPRTEDLVALRQLPNSPCDLMHTNTIEIVDPHPSGLWECGDVLLSFRNLNLVLIADKQLSSIKWWYGRGVLSGQHQPSVLKNGSVLVFDNGRRFGRSRILLIDPLTNTRQWEYGRKPGQHFFTELAGGCEYLDKGRVLVTNAADGSAFIVNRAGRKLWSFNAKTLASKVNTTRVTVYRISHVPKQIVESFT